MSRTIPLLVFATMAVLAQEDPAPEAVFSTETRLVVLHATVADPKGHLVTDLPQKAFQVFEDGAEQQIKVFRREDIPVSLGIVIDNSGSMADKRYRVESAAIGLVEASNPADEVFIVNFNYEPSLDVDFTSDLAELRKGVARIDSRGGTAMRDSVAMALKHLVRRGKHDKKVLLIITDGNDNISKTGLGDLLYEVGRSDVMVYAIGILGGEEPREAKAARRALHSLTETSGGRAFYPKTPAEIESLARRIARDVRNQYTIGYTPGNAAMDGTYRRVRVAVNAPGNLQVRTRTGYYAMRNPANPNATPE